MGSLVSSFRARYQRSLEQRAAKLEPDTRTALAEEIENELGEAATEEDDGDIAELDAALERTRESLAKFEESERFLGSRVSHYTKLLDEKAARLRAASERAPRINDEGVDQQQEELLGGGERETTTEASAAVDIDEERGGSSRDVAESDKRRQLGTELEQHRRDADCLAKVVESHKSILANIESMRRRIRDLEQKKAEILDCSRECRDFLIATAEVEEAEEQGEQQAVDEHQIMMQGHIELATSSDADAYRAAEENVAQNLENQAGINGTSSVYEKEALIKES